MFVDSTLLIVITLDQRHCDNYNQMITLSELPFTLNNIFLVWCCQERDILLENVTQMHTGIGG
jgi:hypothetical protein